MAQLYRKSALDKLSSPEQLDRMIVITSPSLWMAVIGAALIVVVALVWSIFGKLPVKQEASGILVPDQGAYTLASETAGVVSSIDVKLGDYVEQGDVMVTLVDSHTQKEINNLKNRREKVLSVTLESKGDIATQDNRDLIDLKTQIASSNSETERSKTMLSVYKNNLAELKPKVDAAKVDMEAARDKYYSYILPTTDTDVELDFSYFQSVYSTSRSIYDSAYAAYKNQQTSYKKLLEQLMISVKKLNDADNVKSAVDSMEKVQRLVLSPETLNDDALELLEEVSVNALTSLQDSYDMLLLYKDEYEAAKDELEEADDDYDEARSDYEIYNDTRDAVNVEKERAMSVYNELNNDYNNLYSQMVSLEQNIDSLESEIAAAEITAQIQADSYRRQFEATRSALLDNLQSEIDNLDFNLEKSRIRSTVSGTVSDIKVNIGSPVGQGNEVVTLRQLSEENLIVCYIPINSGKKVQPGMTAIIKPTTVNHQEYGHMEAQVVSVDDYVATTAGMRGILGDDSLVQAFTQNGPVVGVTFRLRTDDTNANGYWWSNKKGGNIMLPEGTMVVADIITEQKTPISMLIPMLKEKLTMVVEPEADNGGAG